MNEPTAGEDERPVTMRTILAWPVMRRIATMFGLDRIEYEFTAQRRSFHGKAICRGDHELVRLPLEGNQRHPQYLCLTILHEWAHVLQGRRSRPGRPHGLVWTAHFSALCHEACRQGLFAGNTAEVLRHAASGEAQTNFCRLVGPDGRPLGDTVPAAAPAGTGGTLFHPGDRVECRHDGRLYQGTIVRVNPRTYTVRQDDGLVFRVPHRFHSLRRTDAAAGARPPAGGPLSAGTRVRFPYRGQVVEGRIARVNRTTYRVVAEDHRGEWRVRRDWPGLRPIL